MSEQTFRLATLPPSVNELYRNRGPAELLRAAERGKRLPGRAKTKAYEGWLNSVGWSVNLARPQLIKGDIAIEIIAGRPDRKKRDLGNLEKATSDLLVRHRVIEDDSKIVDIRLRWAAIEGCVVTVRSAA